MDAITDPDVERITLMKSARVGYTKIINHTIAYYMKEDPCPIMVVQPTNSDAEDYSKDDIAPMIAGTPALKGLVSGAKKRESDNTILRKKFPGGTLRLIGSESPRGFRRVSVKVMIFDEVDGYDASAGKEGDQIKLGIRRTEWFEDRKIIMGSTPTAKESSRIERYYDVSNQGRYYVPCPHCDEFQVLKWENLKWDKADNGDHLSGTAHFVCVHCGCLIEESFKQQMIDRGEWRGAKEFHGHAGFHIWAAYSMAPNASWPQLVTEFLESRKSREALKTFTNTVLGETFEEGTPPLKEGELMNRTEKYGPEIPEGAALITAGTDIQKNRIETTIKAWGADGESWNIGHVIHPGDTSKPDAWNSLWELYQKIYIHKSRAKLVISCALIDAGYRTPEVYAFIKKHRGRRIFAVKGASGGNAALIGRPSQVGPAKIPQYLINTILFKDHIYGQLQVEDYGPGYIHFPEEYGHDAEYFKQLEAEKVITNYVGGVAVGKKYIKTRARNEAIDCMVYAYAAYLALNPNMEALLASVKGGGAAKKPARRIRARMKQ